MIILLGADFFSTSAKIKSSFNKHTSIFFFFTEQKDRKQKRPEVVDLHLLLQTIFGQSVCHSTRGSVVDKNIQALFFLQKFFDKFSHRVERIEIQFHHFNIGVACHFYDIIWGKWRSVSGGVTKLLNRYWPFASFALCISLHARMTRAPLCAKSNAVSFPIPVNYQNVVLKIGAKSEADFLSDFRCNKHEI